MSPDRAGPDKAPTSGPVPGKAPRKRSLQDLQNHHHQRWFSRSWNQAAEPNEVVFVLMADDGKIFHGSGVGDVFGPRCFKGDVMGCGIMFPRDYILDEGEAGSFSRLVGLWEGFIFCLLIVVQHGPRFSTYRRVEEDQPPPES